MKNIFSGCIYFSLFVLFSPESYFYKGHCGKFLCSHTCLSQAVLSDFRLPCLVPVSVAILGDLHRESQKFLFSFPQCLGLDFACLAVSIYPNWTWHICSLPRLTVLSPFLILFSIVKPKLLFFYCLELFRKKYLLSKWSLWKWISELFLSLDVKPIHMSQIIHRFFFYFIICNIVN